MGRGLKHHALIEPRRLEPNQGIRASFRNGFKLGWTAGAILGPLIALLVLLTSQFAGTSPRLGGMIGYVWALVIAVAIVFWATNGGMPWLYHYILRLMLWRAGFIPWNYSHFLDSAVSRLLLRKIGGGYLFVHRFILEYFAHLPDPFP